MEKKGRKSSMLVPTIIMGVLAVTLVLIGYSRGQGEHIVGLKSALNMTITVLPMLVFAFTMAGLIQVLLPRDLVSKWVGVESGVRGIFVGTVAGALTPGGPYVSMPIVAGLLHSGASIGTMVAFVTGWSLWAVSRLPLEIGILGWKFTMVRFLSTVVFPPIAGFIAQVLFSGTRWIEPM